jgi:hypothetical protein
VKGDDSPPSGAEGEWEEVSDQETPKTAEASEDKKAADLIKALAIDKSNDAVTTTDGANVSVYFQKALVAFLTRRRRQLTKANILTRKKRQRQTNLRAMTLTSMTPRMTRDQKLISSTTSLKLR